MPEYLIYETKHSDVGMFRLFMKYGRMRQGYSFRFEVCVCKDLDTSEISIELDDDDLRSFSEIIENRLDKSEENLLYPVPSPLNKYAFYAVGNNALFPHIIGKSLVFSSQSKQNISRGMYSSMYYPDFY